MVRSKLCLQLGKEVIPERVGGRGEIEPVGDAMVLREGAKELVIGRAGFELLGGDGFKDFIDAERFVEVVDAFEGRVFDELGLDGLLEFDLRHLEELAGQDDLGVDLEVCLQLRRGRLSESVLHRFRSLNWAAFVDARGNHWRVLRDS